MVETIVLDVDAIRLARPGVDVAAEYHAREAAGRGEALDESDLCDDVRPALSKLRGLGVRVAVAGNQTSRVGDLLRDLDLPVDLIVTSGDWGVAKPQPEFFQRVLEVAQAAPERTVHVGDHPANDVFPARAAGLRVAHRGHCWGPFCALGELVDGGDGHGGARQ
ncbi:HAD family hydrolase [Streptomyces sp. NPDC059010]|uniref:HAD family hydrolase n=1 Tax=Streptomyces sp. NPDC059010 TaxID=3346695 RepID=UPI003682D1FC